MSRYTSSKVWRRFTTPRLHQVKNLDLRAQTHWRYWKLRQSLPWDAWGRNYWSNTMVEVISELLLVKRRSKTHRHPDLHRHGGLPRSTLRLWLQRQHYAQGTLWKILYTSFTRNNPVFAACRLDTKFPKSNIVEPLRPSWYLICSSRLRGDRDWYWWEGTHHPREAIPEHLGSYHLR